MIRTAAVRVVKEGLAVAAAVLVVALEVLGRFRTAGIAIDAGVVDEKVARYIVGKALREVGHVG